MDKIDKNVKKFDISRIIFGLSAAILLLIAGGYMAVNEVQPFPFLIKGYEDLTVFKEEQVQERPILLKKKQFKKDGVIIYKKGKTYDGYTIIQGLFSSVPEIRLIDMKGRIIHKWEVNFFKIWPDPKHIYPPEMVPKSNFNYHIQGLEIFPDGSVLTNISEYGLAKLNKCSEVIWKLDRYTHHSITPDGKGNFWIPAHRELRNVPKKYLFPKDITVSKRIELTKDHYAYENVLLLVSKNGKVKKEFSVLGALFDRKYEKELYSAMNINPKDPTHVNDIEIVTTALAKKIKGVKKGDLLVSIRQLSMLAIFDSKTGKIKWTHSGPWLRQHDPDITEKGNIVVFNNRIFHLNSGRFSGNAGSKNWQD